MLFRFQLDNFILRYIPKTGACALDYRLPWRLGKRLKRILNYFFIYLNAFRSGPSHRSDRRLSD